MILYQGRIYQETEQKNLLEKLKDDCYKTLEDNNKFKTIDVINACDKLAQKVRNKEYDHIVMPLLTQLDIPYSLFENYIYMFEKEALLKKCEIELGSDFQISVLLNEKVKREIVPLGILFHIAAGNVDALPAYSVIEGLLSGNINILKLPTGDSGLSVLLLSELIKIEPRITNYVYVFDVPSTEIDTLKIFADIADGIVVWGSDIAVKAAYQMASVTTKVIPWGHKISFAYASKDATDEDLEGLAHHICQTNQLLCSSAQGIFYDTKDFNQLEKFAKRFFDIFVEVSKTHQKLPIGVRGKNTLEIYANHLEAKPKSFFSQNGVSVVVEEDSLLKVSNLFRNIWVKRLERNKIIRHLKPHKNHLQTVGLICGDLEFESLASQFRQAGLVKISKPIDMSNPTIGEAHDGTYPLREYTKIVETTIVK